MVRLRLLHAEAWAGPACLIVTAGLMIGWTWATWPDVLIDFGRELYVAWRLSEGHVLYRDVAWFNGPLSPYLNATWFRVLGVRIRSLAIANVLLAGMLT